MPVFENGNWLNEPSEWSRTSAELQVVTDQSTDFWRKTHYGFTRDKGHFLGFETKGDFTAELRVRARYEALYDQAGLMVRLDETRWVKAGVELSDGRGMLSSVLTDGISDWSIGVFDGNPAEFWLRATVSAGVLRLQASADGTTWPLMRLASFPQAATYRVGPMCCTPERAGLRVAFSDFRIGPPLHKDLHDLS
jgi:uncharacterized protein